MRRTYRVYVERPNLFLVKSSLCLFMSIQFTGMYVGSSSNFTSVHTLTNMLAQNIPRCVVLTLITVLLLPLTIGLPSAHASHAYGRLDPIGDLTVVVHGSRLRVTIGGAPSDDLDDTASTIVGGIVDVRDTDLAFNRTLAYLAPVADVDDGKYGDDDDSDGNVGIPLDSRVIPVTRAWEELEGRVLELDLRRVRKDRPSTPDTTSDTIPDNAIPPGRYTLVLVTTCSFDPASRAYHDRCGSTRASIRGMSWQPCRPCAGRGEWGYRQSKEFTITT